VSRGRFADGGPMPCCAAGSEADQAVGGLWLSVGVAGSASSSEERLAALMPADPIGLGVTAERALVVDRFDDEGVVLRR
jgi:hypothetical protein